MPSSLNVISNKIGNGGPLLEPYPNWSWAKNQNCSGITSVYRIAVIKNCFHIGIATINFYNIKDTLHRYTIIWKIDVFLNVDPCLQQNLSILYFLIICFFVSFSQEEFHFCTYFLNLVSTAIFNICYKNNIILLYSMFAFEERKIQLIYHYYIIFYLDWRMG